MTVNNGIDFEIESKHLFEALSIEGLNRHHIIYDEYEEKIIIDIDEITNDNEEENYSFLTDIDKGIFTYGTCSVVKPYENM